MLIEAEGPGNPSLQFPTRCVHNVAIDWLDENYIASCQATNDPTICIWDRRIGSRFITPAVGPANALETSQLGPSLEFGNVIAPKSTIWSLRFSRTKRGCLGVLSNTGHFKTYDIVKEYLDEEMRSSMDETLGQGSARNYPEQIYTKHVRDVVTPYNHPSRGYDEKDRIVAFDFLNMSPGNEPSAITISGNDEVNILTAKPPAPPVRLSSQGTLIWGTSDEDSDFRAINPQSSRGLSISEMVEEVRERAESDSNGQTSQKGRRAGNRPATPLSSREAREHALSLGTLGGQLPVKDALTLLSVNRFRCKEGYLFDEARNKKILADDPWLQGFWDWAERKCGTEYHGLY